MTESESVSAAPVGFPATGILDINRDGHVSADDARAVIEDLNLHGAGPAPADGRFDVNTDGVRSPIDALMLLNYLNSHVDEDVLDAVARDTADLTAAAQQGEARWHVVFLEGFRAGKGRSGLDDQKQRLEETFGDEIVVGPVIPWSLLQFSPTAQQRLAAEQIQQHLDGYDAVSGVFFVAHSYGATIGTNLAVQLARDGHQVAIVTFDPIDFAKVVLWPPNDALASLNQSNYERPLPADFPIDYAINFYQRDSLIQGDESRIQGHILGGAENIEVGPTNHTCIDNDQQVDAMGACDDSTSLGISNRIVAMIRELVQQNQFHALPPPQLISVSQADKIDHDALAGLAALVSAIDSDAGDVVATAAGVVSQLAAGNLIGAGTALAQRHDPSLASVFARLEDLFGSIRDEDTIGTLAGVLPILNEQLDNTSNTIQAVFDGLNRGDPLGAVTTLTQSFDQEAGRIVAEVTALLKRVDESQLVPVLSNILDELSTVVERFADGVEASLAFVEAILTPFESTIQWADHEAQIVGTQIEGALSGLNELPIDLAVEGAVALADGEVNVAEGIGLLSSAADVLSPDGSAISTVVHTLPLGPTVSLADALNDGDVTVPEATEILSSVADFLGSGNPAGSFIASAASGIGVGYGVGQAIPDSRALAGLAGGAAAAAASAITSIVFPPAAPFTLIASWLGGTFGGVFGSRTTDHAFKRLRLETDKHTQSDAHAKMTSLTVDVLAVSGYDHVDEFAAFADQLYAQIHAGPGKYQFRHCHVAADQTEALLNIFGRVLLAELQEENPEIKRLTQIPGFYDKVLETVNATTIERSGRAVPIEHPSQRASFFAALGLPVPGREGHVIEILEPCVKPPRIYINDVSSVDEAGVAEELVTVSGRVQRVDPGDTVQIIVGVDHDILYSGPRTTVAADGTFQVGGVHVSQPGTQDDFFPTSYQIRAVAVKPGHADLLPIFNEHNPTTTMSQAMLTMEEHVLAVSEAQAVRRGGISTTPPPMVLGQPPINDKPTVDEPLVNTELEITGVRPQGHGPNRGDMVSIRGQAMGEFLPGTKVGVVVAVFTTQGRREHYVQRFVGTIDENGLFEVNARIGAIGKDSGRTFELTLFAFNGRIANEIPLFFYGIASDFNKQLTPHVDWIGSREYYVKGTTV